MAYPLGNQPQRNELRFQGQNYLAFIGNIKYCTNNADINDACTQLLDIANKRQIVFGFDLEWPVNFTGRAAKTALMQICMSEKECFLFHIYNLNNLPSNLISLLKHQNVKLAGINIEHDIKKLAQDFNVDLTTVIQNKIIELSDLANTKLRSNTEWGLASLTHRLVGKNLDKSLPVRISDWSKQISHEQLKYAATDAYASWLCYVRLSQL